MGVGEMGTGFECGSVEAGLDAVAPVQVRD